MRRESVLLSPTAIIVVLGLIGSTYGVEVLEPGYDVEIYASYADPGAGNIYNIVFGDGGNLYVSHRHDQVIYKVNPHGQVSVFASGFGTMGIEWGTGTAYGNYLYVADGAINGQIRKIAPDGTVSGFASFGPPRHGLALAAIDRTGNYGGLFYTATGGQDHTYSVTTSGSISMFSDFPGWKDGGGPSDIAFDTTGNYGGFMYMVVCFNNSHGNEKYSGLFALDPSGNAIRFTEDLRYLMRIDFDRTGNFGGKMFAIEHPGWAVEGNGIWKLEQDGKATLFATTTMRLSDLTFGPDGSMYVAEYVPQEEMVIVSRVCSTGEPRTIYVDKDAEGQNNGWNWSDAYNDLEDALCAARYGDEIRVAQGAYSPEGPLSDIHQASNPSPVDGSYTVSINTDLSWTAGYDAISHDVYFGTSNPPPFIQNQTGTTFDPGTMAYSTVYYWRIDEVDDSVITTGDIWCFTTIMSPPPPLGSSNEDESIGPAADRSATFQLQNGVVIKGGYAGFGQPDPNERDIDKYKTILSGDLNGDDVEVNDPCDLLTEPSRAENSYHVVSISDCNESAVLDGFTITAGNANGEYYPLNQGSGGGIQIRFGAMGEEGPVLKNCTFIGNSARSGGGMYNDHSSTTLTNCTFRENFAEWGGGIGNSGFPGPKLVNCTFIANRAGYKGGAIANAESRPTLENCKLIANHAELGGAIYNGEAGAILTNCTLIGNSAERGGAVYNNDGSVRMTNCIVSENSCTEKGGVVYLGSDDGATLTNCILTANSAYKGGVLYIGNDSYAKLKNCTVTGNWATDNGGALYFDGPDGAIITNCILWSDTPQEIYPDLLGNEIVITYNDVQGGWPGQGNINVEPCFVDAGYWDANGVWIDGDYHLLQTSACINAGDNNSLPADTQDLDGDGNTVEPIPFDIEGSPRIVYDVVDMGAYEFDNIPPIADAGPDQIVECACNTEGGTKVILDGTNSNDPDDGLLTYTWTGPFVGSPVQEATPTITLEGGCPGEYVITLVVNDGIDESEPNDVVITVVDTTPPEFEFSVMPTMLWPPDHKMVEITPSWTVSDDCVSTPDVSLVSIVANEGDDTIGDGHTSNDIQIGEDGSIYLRSERTGTGNDRIYTITYQAVDDCGNVTIRSAIVSIPHDFKFLARIAARWLWTHQTGNIPEDLNGDGIVNFADFATFAQNWIK